MPMRTSRHGDSVPLVTTPPPSIALPGRGMPRPVRRNGRRRAAGRASPPAPAGAAPGAPLAPLAPEATPHAAHRAGADEPRALLAAPAEPALDRPALLGQVVAVERQARLEAQRVA